MKFLLISFILGLSLISMVFAPMSAATETVIINANGADVGPGVAIGIVCGTFADAGLRAGAQQASLFPVLAPKTRLAVEAILAKASGGSEHWSFGKKQRSSNTAADIFLGAAILGEKAGVGAASVGVINPGILANTDYLETLEFCWDALGQL